MTALSELWSAINVAREQGALPSRGAIEGVLVLALQVAYEALPPAAAAVRSAITLALATYDDAMQLAMTRAALNAAASGVVVTGRVA